MEKSSQLHISGALVPGKKYSVPVENDTQGGFDTLQHLDVHPITGHKGPEGEGVEI